MKLSVGVWGGVDDGVPDGNVSSWWGRTVEVCALVSAAGRILGRL